jgi:hypothetical protein
MIRWAQAPVNSNSVTYRTLQAHSAQTPAHEPLLAGEAGVCEQNN